MELLRIPRSGIQMVFFLETNQTPFNRRGMYSLEYTLWLENILENYISKASGGEAEKQRYGGG